MAVSVLIGRRRWSFAAPNVQLLLIMCNTRGEKMSRDNRRYHNPQLSPIRITTMTITIRTATVISTEIKAFTLERLPLSRSLAFSPGTFYSDCDIGLGHCVLIPECRGNYGCARCLMAYSRREYSTVLETLMLEEEVWILILSCYYSNSGQYYPG